MEGCEAVMSLGFGSTNFVSKTIAEFISRTSSIGNVQKRLLKLEEYVRCLEEERSKIHAFKRELPLCMFLLSDAIVYLKEYSRSWCKRGSGEVEKPVLKEIDLLKDNEQENRREGVESITKDGDSVDKKSWMSSFQLWNSDLNPTVESTNVKDKVEGSSKPKMGCLLETLESKEENASGSFKVSSSVPGVGVAWKEEKIPLSVPELSLVPPAVTTLVQMSGSSDLKSRCAGLVDYSGSASAQLNKSNGMMMPQQQQQSCRKQRRCWSPDLHKTFVSALQQLGGPQAATPKQIRDLMQVDGLTNDEVKSHLQKYRLHIRRLPNKQMDDSASQSTVVLGVAWNNQDHCVESSKNSKGSDECSPAGPLELCVHLQGNDENDGSYD
ncbi:unnamed protein product [Rhodiola kirilowii]